MSYTDQSSFETGENRILTKKVKGLSFMQDDLGKVIWKPKAGYLLVLSKVIYRRVKVAPDNADPAPPSIEMTDGINPVVFSTSIVPDVQQLELVVTPSVAIDNKHPLTLNQLGQTGSDSLATEWDYELILVATKLND